MRIHQTLALLVAGVVLVSSTLAFAAGVAWGQTPKVNIDRVELRGGDRDADDRRDREDDKDKKNKKHRKKCASRPCPDDDRDEDRDAD